MGDWGVGVAVRSDGGARVDRPGPTRRGIRSGTAEAPDSAATSPPPTVDSHRSDRAAPARLAHVIRYITAWRLAWRGRSRSSSTRTWTTTGTPTSGTGSGAS